MGRLRNKSLVPAGMLAPSGLDQTPVDPTIQATVRPAGVLLAPSPGYDSVRAGKNRFQGRGPTGGFRRMQFAEDVGGTGAALAVTPGDTASIPSEWLPNESGFIPEGSMIISDRTHEPGFARRLHEAYGTLVDMGDRHPDRPRSRWLVNPVGMFRQDYQEHPAVTVMATAGLVWLISYIARDLETAVRGYRPRGVGTAVSEPVAAAPVAAGDVTKQIADATGEAVNKIGQVTDEAVSKIAGAADNAVNAISKAAE